MSAELERCAPFIGGDDRLQMLLTQNLQILKGLLQVATDPGVTAQEVRAMAHAADVAAKNLEQKARLLGVDMKKIRSAEKLESVEAVLEFYRTATQKIKGALVWMEKYAPAEYAKAKELLNEIRAETKAPGLERDER